jgi:hypothetical protein
MKISELIKQIKIEMVLYNKLLEANKKIVVKRIRNFKK